MISRVLAAFVAAFLAGSFTLADLAQASIWADRAAVRRPAPPAPAPSDLTAAMESLLARTASGSVLDAIPLGAGTVRSFHRQPRAGAPVAVVIQDVHRNDEAQRNIAAIVASLARAAGKNGRLMVGVEGAFGPSDFSEYLRAAPRDRLRAVADGFLSRGEIAAASYLGVTGGAPRASFVGADDLARYRENVAALLRAQRAEPALSLSLNRERAEAAAVIAASNNAALRRLDAARERFHADGALGACLTELAALNAETRGPPLDAALTRFLSAYDIEKRIDYARVERQRERVVREFAAAASPDEIRALAALAVDYRSGRLSYAAFYGRMREAFERRPGLLDANPAFDLYLRYVLLSDGIEPDAVQAAARRLSNRLAARVARTDAERAMLARADALRMNDRLLHFSLTPPEWREARDLRRAPAWAPFEAFYRAADARSLRLAETLDTRTRAARTSTAALIVGGFHTPDAAAALYERGYSVAVVQPKVTRLGDGTAYLGLFAREKVLLDQLFQGETLFLADAATNLGFAPFGDAVGKRFLAEAQAPTRAPPVRSGLLRRAQVAAVALAAMIGSIGMAPQTKALEVTNAPPAATQPSIDPARLTNLTALQTGIRRVMSAVDPYRSAAYQDAVYSLLLETAMSETSGALPQDGKSLGLFRLPRAVALDVMLHFRNSDPANAKNFPAWLKAVFDTEAPAVERALAQATADMNAAVTDIRRQAARGAFKSDAERNEWINARYAAALAKEADALVVLETPTQKFTFSDLSHGRAEFMAFEMRLYYLRAPGAVPINAEPRERYRFKTYRPGDPAASLVASLPESLRARVAGAVAEKPAFSDAQLRNINEMRDGIARVVAATDGQRPAAYRAGVERLLFETMLVETGGDLTQDGDRLGMFRMPAGDSLRTLLYFRNDNVHYRKDFAARLTAALGAERGEVFNAALGEATARIAEADRKIAADAEKLRFPSPNDKASWIATRHAEALTAEAFSLPVYTMDDGRVTTAASLFHFDPVVMSFVLRLQIFTAAEAVPGADDAAQGARDRYRQKYLGNLTRSAVPAGPVAARLPGLAPAIAPAATGPSTAPTTRPLVAADNARALTEMHGAFVRVISVVDADRSPDEKKAALRLMMGTLVQEGYYPGVGFVRRQLIGRPPTPRGVAVSYLQVEPWSGLDLMPYLAGRPQAKAWFKELFGAEKGAALFDTLNAFKKEQKAEWDRVDAALKAKGLSGKELTRAAYPQRKAWLEKRAQSLLLPLGADGAGVPFAAHLQNDDLFAALVGRMTYFRRSSDVPMTDDDASLQWKRDYNTASGRGDPRDFQKKLRMIPRELNEFPLVMLWTMDTGRAVLRRVLPFGSILPKAAVDVIAGTAFAAVVEAPLLFLPTFARAWHENETASAANARGLRQALVLAATAALTLAAPGVGVPAIAAAGAGLVLFHMINNAVEMIRTGDTSLGADRVDARRAAVAAALERLLPVTEPIGVGLSPSDIPRSGRRLAALADLAGRINDGSAGDAAALWPAFQAVWTAAADELVTPADLESDSLNVHLLDAGESPASAAEALTARRERRGVDVILVGESDAASVADLNARFNGRRILFLRQSEADRDRLVGAAASMGWPETRGLNVIVGPSPSADALLMGVFSELERRDNARIYMRAGAAGVASAILVLISFEKLTDLIQTRIEAERLVATQA